MYLCVCEPYIPLLCSFLAVGYRLYQVNGYVAMVCLIPDGLARTVGLTVRWYDRHTHSHPLPSYIEHTTLISL